MTFYAVSKSDPFRVVYLGTSVKEAEEAVGEFVKYQKDEDHFPTKSRRLMYSALPVHIQREMIQFYMCDGRWYSIEMFELETQGETNG